MSDDRDAFLLGSDFSASVPTGGLGLGFLESQYEELFAEVLEDGTITSEERDRLAKAAQNLGLDPDRLARLEEAMTTAYETHHRTRIVKSTPEGAHASLAPLPVAPPLGSAVTGASGAPATSGEIAQLRFENTQLRERVAQLEAELEQARAAVNVEVDLGDLESHAAASGDDPADIWKQIRRDPLRPDAYRALRACYSARGEHDGVFLASQALVALGHATSEDVATHERHRTHGLIAARTSVDAITWDDCLFHPEEDRITGAIFSIIAPAVLIGRVTTLRRDGKLRLPVPDKKQDPATSTVMAARAVGWAATLLGLPCPGVFIDKDDDGEFLHNPGVPPTTRLGRQALSGRSAPELAFLVGRHLTGYRGEHFVRTLFSATEDLEDLFLAALLLANPTLPLTGGVRARVEPLARAIAPLLEPLQLDALRGYYLRFAEEGGRTNLQRWGSAVDKTAQRVGLGLSQDLGSCLGWLTGTEGPSGPLAQDLLAFSTSDRFLLLRRRLGLAVETE